MSVSRGPFNVTLPSAKKFDCVLAIWSKTFRLGSA